VHVLAPAPDHVPLVQGAHEVELAAPAKVPFAQGVHDGASRVAEKEPAGHTLQLAPLPAEPRGQGWAATAVQLSESPLSVDEKPGEHEHVLGREAPAPAFEPELLGQALQRPALKL